ncbi:DUF1415 domain-containing protein [Microbulbifer sp. SAOS-129_SWC]|uniref:DUF1415 domain-containing protein n=1 Tax=Microbulbifer sp. SAOS-129_SWC TaxID=3145235 RepID=UPI0032176F6C
MQQVIEPVQQWLADVVVGLNLCPFARKPLRAGQVRYRVSKANDEKALMAELLEEMQLLDVTAAEEVETTLLIIPDYLRNFSDYNQFLELAEWLIERQEYSGIYQLATFHPNYQFAGTAPEDAENLTNRAPYPILHILREASVEMILAKYPNPDSIPENNIRLIKNISGKEKRRLFPFLHF